MSLAPNITLVSNYTGTVSLANSVVVAVVGGVGALLHTITGEGAGDVQALALLAKVKCARPDVQDTLEYLQRIITPIGLTDSANQRLYGSFLIVSMILVIHLIVAAGFYVKYINHVGVQEKMKLESGDSFEDKKRRTALRKEVIAAASATARFPSLSYSGMLFLFQGLALETALASAENRENSMVMSAICGMFTLTMIVTLSIFGLKYYKARYQFYNAALQDFQSALLGTRKTHSSHPRKELKGSDAHEASKKQEKEEDEDSEDDEERLVPKRSTVQILFSPSGYWAPEGYRLRYGHVVGTFRKHRAWFASFLWVRIALLSITAALHIVEDCGMQFVLIGCVLGAYAVLLLILHPHRMLWVSIASAVGNVMVAMLALSFYYDFEALPYYTTAVAIFFFLFGIASAIARGIEIRSLMPAEEQRRRGAADQHRKGEETDWIRLASSSQDDDELDLKAHSEPIWSGYSTHPLLTVPSQSGVLLPAPIVRPRPPAALGSDSAVYSLLVEHESLRRARSGSADRSRSRSPPHPHGQSPPRSTHCQYIAPADESPPTALLQLMFNYQRPMKAEKSPKKPRQK